MSANKEGGQGTQKSGQKPIPENDEDVRQPGQQPGQQRDQGGQGRQDQQDRPAGGKENR